MTNIFSKLIATDIVGIQPITYFPLHGTINKKSWKVKCIATEWVVEETTLPAIFTLLRLPVKYHKFNTEAEANEYAMLKMLEQ
jgi:hypothetical protein